MIPNKHIINISRADIENDDLQGLAIFWQKMKRLMKQKQKRKKPIAIEVVRSGCVPRAALPNRPPVFGVYERETARDIYRQCNDATIVCMDAQSNTWGECYCMVDVNKFYDHASYMQQKSATRHFRIFKKWEWLSRPNRIKKFVNKYLLIIKTKMKWRNKNE